MQTFLSALGPMFAGFAVAAFILAALAIRREMRARLALRRRMWAVLDHLQEQKRRGGAGIARW